MTVSFSNTGNIIQVSTTDCKAKLISFDFKWILFWNCTY